MNNSNPPLSLKQALFLSFGVELPIKGGNGINKEKAIIIERVSSLNDYVSTEHLILKYLGIARDLIRWNIVKQKLVFENNLIYDVIELNVVMNQNEQWIVQTEYFYFDISQCYGRKEVSQEAIDKKFVKMKLYIDKLLNEIEKDKEQE